MPKINPGEKNNRLTETKKGKTRLNSQRNKQETGANNQGDEQKVLPSKTGNKVYGRQGGQEKTAKPRKQRRHDMPSPNHDTTGSNVRLCRSMINDQEVQQLFQQSGKIHETKHTRLKRAQL